MASSKKRLVVSWILSLLPSLMMLGPSAYFKLNPPPEVMADFEKANLTAQKVFVIGVVEIVIVLLYLFPRTSFIGAILVTGYLGGATFVHVSGGDPIYMPVIFGIIIWGGLGLRRPEIFQLAFGSSTKRDEGSAA